MQSADTPSELLTYIVAQGGAAVATLVGALGLADATVRRHLTRLEAERLISARLVRQSTGRPFHFYQATAAGVRRQRDRSADLAARLLSQVTAAGAELTSVAEGLADQVAADHRDQVPQAGPLEARVAGTVEALRAEGILDGWERTAAGYRLHNHGCPYQSAAAASDCLCESDRLTIEKLIGAEVQQVGSLAHGDAACEYVVAAAKSTTSAPRASQRRARKGDVLPL